MQNYCFPKLKNRDILACLRDLGTPLTLNDLKEPKADILIPIYGQLMELLMGINKEMIKTPNLNAMNQHIQQSELHETSLYQMTYVKKILKLLSVCGIPECNLNTLYYPTAKQVKLIFSGIINFAKFREERMTTYQTFTESTNELLELKTTLQQHNEQLAPLVDELKKQRENEMPIIEQLNHETEQAAGKIAENNKIYMKLTKENRKYKHELTIINDNISNEKLSLLNLSSKIDKLRMQVVRSPEKLKAAIKKMGQNCTELTTDISVARKNYQKGQKTSLDESFEAAIYVQKTVELFQRIQELHFKRII